MTDIRIAIVGDYDPARETHAAVALGVTVAPDWTPTEEYQTETSVLQLKYYHGVLEETDPDSPALVTTRLSGSLRGLDQEVRIVPGTRAAEAYGVDRTTEKFMCRFGVNEAYRERLFGDDLLVSGTDAEGNVRIAESRTHPFFMGTLFVPQMSSEAGRPHPLLVAFVQAAKTFAGRRTR